MSVVSCIAIYSPLCQFHSLADFTSLHPHFLSLCYRYARKHFSSSDQLLKDVQQAMGLLAFDPSTRIRRYQKLFSLSRWVGLIDQFRQENFGLYQLSQRSVLSVTLQAGLSALKTPYPSNP